MINYKVKSEAELALVALSICKTSHKNCKYSKKSCYNMSCAERIVARACKPAKRAEEIMDKIEDAKWASYGAWC